VCIEVERKDTVAARNARSGYLHDTIVASLGEHSGNWTRRPRKKTTEILIRCNGPSGSDSKRDVIKLNFKTIGWEGLDWI
jgi:hypothetical protein